MKKVKKKILNWFLTNKLQILVLFLYSIICLFVISRHELWRDEAQAWLLSRDLSIFDLVNQMKSEGHFLLWYLIIMPFAKLNFPPFTINLISFIITLISAWLILKYSKFKKVIQYLLLLSFPMIYCFPVVARCYCIIPLAITLISMFHGERNQKPIRYVISILLLSCTHVIMLGMVGILLFNFFVEQLLKIKNASVSEKNRLLLCFSITISVLFLNAFPLFGSLSTNNSLLTNYRIGYFDLIFEMFIAQPIEMLAINFPIFNGATLFIILLIFFIIEFRKSFLISLGFAFMFLWQFFVYSTIYVTSFQRAAVFILMMMCYFWINPSALKKNVIKDIMIVIFLILSVIKGFEWVYMDLNSEFSTGYKVANYINANKKKETIIIADDNLEFYSPIMMYVDQDVKFYYIQGDNFFSYANWDEDKIKIEDDFYYSLYEKFNDNGDIYYIQLNYNNDESNIISELINESIFVEKLSTDTGMVNENYVLYKIDFNKLKEKIRGNKL